jgi:hypothetical protein
MSCTPNTAFEALRAWIRSRRLIPLLLHHLLFLSSAGLLGCAEPQTVKKHIAARATRVQAGESKAGKDDAHVLKAEDQEPIKRFELAKSLDEQRTLQSFRTLLKLLTDSDSGVSYAAAEALEKRGDVAFASEFMATIPALRNDARWPAYRALRRYPTISVFQFLLSCLNDELSFYRAIPPFDERNCFYMTESLKQIAGDLWKSAELPSPEPYSVASYDQFYRAGSNLAKK